MNNEEARKRRKASQPLTEEEKRIIRLLCRWTKLYSEVLTEEYPDWTEEQVEEKSLELAKAEVFNKLTLEIVFRQQARLNRQYAMRTGDLKKPLTYEELRAWSAACADKKNRAREAWEAETYNPKNDEARRKELLRLHELDERYWKGSKKSYKQAGTTRPHRARSQKARRLDGGL